MAQVANAKLVRYIDENGKTHYVNPDFVKIPEQYLPQVKRQLLEMEADRQKKNQFMNTNADSGIPAYEHDGWEESPPSQLDPSSFNAHAAPYQNASQAPSTNYFPDSFESQDTSYQQNIPSEDGTSDGETKKYQKPATTTVELFISKGCPDCDSLEQALIANNIPYKKHDIDYSSYAKQVYQNNGSQVPLVRVWNQIFYTTNINTVKDALYRP